MAGGNLDMSARGFTDEQMRHLAMAAAGAEARLTVRDFSHLTSENLRHIAMAAKVASEPLRLSDRPDDPRQHARERNKRTCASCAIIAIAQLPAGLASKR
jgi:hypothetical protein